MINSKTLRGLNPDEVQGHVLRPTEDMEVWVVPDRGLEVLDVLIEGKPVMFRNPMGHRGRFSYNGYGLGPLPHIEGAFTAGLENVGGPTGVAPLHGTFSVTPADPESVMRTETRGITGKIYCNRIVVGPHINVTRTIEPIKGKRAFLIHDDLEASVTSYYMWLYHPNFPVENGTRFYSSERVVVARPSNKISELDMEKYRTFERVGEGVARFPPSDDTPEIIREENFEKCYIMQMQPDKRGNVYVMLISPNGNSASYIRYNVNNFQPVQQAFQFWKNPRNGVSGLEIGSTFLGWDYARAKEHDLLCRLEKGEHHRYELEIGFLRSGEEVNVVKGLTPHLDVAELLTMEMKDPRVAQLYRGKKII